MSIGRSVIFFLICWGIFLTAGTFFGMLQWRVPANLQRLAQNVFPFLSAVFAYSLIWWILIRGKFEVFNRTDFQNLRKAVWLPILIILTGMQLVNQSFVDIYNKIFYPEYFNLFSRVGAPGKLPALFPSLVAVFLAPLLEEILFRKVIFGALLSRSGFWVAMLLSSFYFGLMHFPYWGKMLPTFVMGCVSAYIFFRTEKLFYPVLLHFGNNLISMLTDVYFPEVWDYLHQFDFNLWYWLIIMPGALLMGFGLRRFEAEVKKNPQENL